MENKLVRLIPLVLAIVAGVGVPAYAAPPSGHSAQRPKPAAVDSALAAEAKISMQTARATALAAVPGGTIRSAELEREHRKLIYSFDIKVKGKPGIEEVHIDANDGHLVNVTHESPKAERKEAAQEKKSAAAPSSR